MHSILVYHTISSPPTPLPGDIDISPDRFEQQLHWLSRHRNVVKLERTLLAPKQPRTTAITFDDGFRDNLTVALPLLEKFQFPMTLFVVADYVGRKNYLTRDELLELSSHPLITIASHGFSHRHFNLLTADRARFELIESRLFLSTITRKEVTLLAWPFGECNRSLEKLAEDCGYYAAWSVWKGTNGRFSRWRVPLGRNDNLLRFMAKANGVYALTKAQWHRLKDDEDLEISQAQVSKHRVPQGRLSASE